ncbi:ERGIC-53-like mannose binding lectin that is a type I membrane protein [Cryptosporidium ryanae]|uniref:ERGIC-53-like mannose binding lectin that is a type I membrane protein n=1 Tax=Cryptosporidium ryanae TaxID=515981 RepID=UPI00351A7B96|nr:ERGIC-53-like mannose binding lectin that is a type I membrane protein [Cryptosporidium ryanae]
MNCIVRLFFKSIFRIRLLIFILSLINISFLNESLFCSANDPSLAAHPSHESIKQQKIDKVTMVRHSFESPLTLDTTLAEWDLAMATIPVKKSVVLVPGVKNRTGQFWNKGPLNTSHFEIYLTFEVVSTSADIKQEGEGFAMWFVSESYGSIYPKSSEDLESWNLLGYKNNPKGIGVLFSLLDRNNKKNPSISLLISDGNKVFSSHADVPTHVGVYFNFVNLEEPLTFRLYVSPDNGISGQIRTTPTSKWIDCFKTDSAQIPESIKNGGFIGFTSYTGPELNDSSSKAADRISIINLNVYNLDLNRAGEEVADSLKYESNYNKEHVEVTDLLRETHVHGDKDVSEALKAFSQILYKHITEATPREQAIHRTLNTLLSQVQKLSNEVKEMQRILSIHTGNNHSETLNSVQSEIVGLKTLFDRHSKHHTNSLIELEGTIKNKEDVATQVHNAIKSQHSTTSIAAVVLVIIILVFGLIMWKKVKDIEKKHLL